MPSKVPSGPGTPRRRRPWETKRLPNGCLNFDPAAWVGKGGGLKLYITFVNDVVKIAPKSRDFREFIARTSNSSFQTIAILEQFSPIFVVHFRMVVSCTWSPLQATTGCTLHNMK